MINEENNTDIEVENIAGENTPHGGQGSAGDANEGEAAGNTAIDLNTVEGLRAALAAMETKADDHWQRYLRTAAEMENVRKRARRDVEHAHKFGLEKLAADVLGVLDSLSLGLEAARENATVESLMEGSEATYRLLNQVLERHGITAINPQGQPFDPALHEAMTTLDAPDVPPNTVVQVIQPGFEIHGRLLRAARVLVSKG